MAGMRVNGGFARGIDFRYPEAGPELDLLVERRLPEIGLHSYGRRYSRQWEHAGYLLDWLTDNSYKVNLDYEKLGDWGSIGKVKIHRRDARNYPHWIGEGYHKLPMVAICHGFLAITEPQPTAG